MAVSYTHLDVYKRQALESCVYTQKVYDLIVERGFVPTFTVEAAE